MTTDPASPSQRAAVRAQRRARRNERIARRETFFDLVASGYSCRQIAEAAKVSAATVRREIDRAIAERRLDAPERYAHVQVARLTKALRLADAAIERGELKAVRPLVRLVAALDRYHGLGRAGAQRAPAAGAPPPPTEALALPAPPLAPANAASPLDGVPPIADNQLVEFVDGHPGSGGEPSVWGGASP